MNDILRSTSRAKLINSLLSPTHESDPSAPPKRQPDVIFGLVLTDSRLDDEQRVAAITFSDTPEWLQRLNRDPCGFPKKTLFGTIWKGIDTSSLDECERTEFIRAVMGGDSNLHYAEMLAEYEDTDVNIQDNQGRTALHWACEKNHTVMVQLCLSVPECDVGLRDDDGLTPFDISLRGGNKKTASLFYRNIFETETRDPQAALLRVLTVSSVVTKDKTVFPGAALFHPIVNRNKKLVAALIDRGIDLTATNENGDTALHVAAAKPANIEIATMLLSAGSDVNALGHGGTTPLHCAAGTADTQMVEILLACKANIAVLDNSGKAPLDQAVENGQLDIQRVLLLHEGVSGMVDGEEVKDGERVKDGEGVENGKRLYDGEEITVPEVTVEHHTADIFLNPVKCPGTLPGQSGSITDAMLDRLVNIDQRNQNGLTALLQAALDGNLDTVRELLLFGAAKEAVDDLRRTALHLAAKQGHTEVVNILLASGAILEAVTTWGFTPLHLAVSSGSVETIKTLLAGGAHIEAKDQGGYTALHSAAQDGHADIAETLLASGAELEAITEGGSTPLHLATADGHTKIIKILLARGAKLESVTEGGFTPLHLAASNGLTEAVKTLLAGGAHLEARQRPGYTTQLLGVGGENTKTGFTALQMAAKEGHWQIVEILRASGRTLEAVTEGVSTPSYSAGFNEATVPFKSFLAGGAQIQATDNEESTPLPLAECNGQPEIDATDEAGYTALHWAADNGNIHQVKTLLASGAKLEATTSKGFTPLHLAATCGHIDIVKTLLAGGAWIEARENEGYTALAMAARDGRTETVRALLVAGAQIEARSPMGTALKLASKNNRSGVVAILRAAGAHTTSAGRLGFAVLQKLGIQGQQK